MREQHPFCGAQTTVQRWWADPLLNAPARAGGQDRTLLTVFTHDHFGPSSHQHHGLYAALVVEPAGSVWQTLDGRGFSNGAAPSADGTGTAPRADGGPTSYAANIVTPKLGVACNVETDPGCVDKERTAREFNLAFADYALLYSGGNGGANRPVNPPNRVEGNLPSPVLHTGTSQPEGISTKDPGSQLINYRNEPIPLRVGDQVVPAPGEAPRNPLSCAPLPDGGRACMQQKPGAAGDMANVFSSKTHEGQGDAGSAIFTEALGRGRGPGDPAPPLLMAYAGDRVQVRLIQGTQEENHVFNMHGVKWLSQPSSPNSGYMNAQPIGISEHFEFNVNIDPASPQRDTDYLYSSTATDNLWDGQWGLMRAFRWDSTHPFLRRLPSNPPARPDDVIPAAGSACPSGSPQRRIDASAVLARDWLDDVSLRQNGTALPNLRNADDAEDTGHKAFNYRSEPFWARLGAAPSAEPDTMNDFDFSDVLSSRVSRGACRADPAHGKFCDPETPVFQANAGDAMRFRVVHSAGHPRNHAFALFGHDWQINPWACDSKTVGRNPGSPYRVGAAGGIGPARHVNVVTTAGGDFHVPGDYLYRTQESFMFAGGLWGLLRVGPDAGGRHEAPQTACAKP